MGMEVQSSEEILAHLEQVTGRKLRSCDAVDRYLKELARDEDRRERSAFRKRIFRETLLLGLALVAFFNYYYWDVSLQIASVPIVKIFVPLAKTAALTR
jgi:hypothetical protein